MFFSTYSTGTISGMSVPVYKICCPSLRGKEYNLQISFSSKEGETLLDTLLLAKWEDLAWKNTIQYDVTACPTRVVNGGKMFLVQLNKNLKLRSDLPGSKRFATFFESNTINFLSKHVLFCLQREDKSSPALVPSVEVPKGSILVIANTTPTEYGHVLLVPYHLYHPPYHMDVLELVLLLASELRNGYFHMAYDHQAIRSGNSYFQACYITNQLAVGHMPFLSLFDAFEEGITIYEVIGYPIRTLVFCSNTNLKLLAAVVSETCSFLNDQSIQFSLLISNSGRKVFLFLQNDVPANHLSAWECGGHFVFCTSQEFDQANENDILQKMVAAALDDDAFEAVKKQSRSIAHRLVALEINARS